MIKELEQLGLDRSEVEIYLSLLKLGKATVGELSKKSKIKRTSIYDILNRLSAHGLISSITEEGTNHYHPKNPENLMDTITEQQHALESILPFLTWISSNPNIKTRVEKFNTPNSVELIYNDTLKMKNDNHYCIVPELGQETIDQSYIQKYIKKRVSNKTVINEIYQTSKKINLTKEEHKMALRNIKTLPLEYPIDTEICIYAKNKVAFISYEDKTGVKIIDKQVYNTFKSIYQISWDKLPELE